MYSCRRVSLMLSFTKAFVGFVSLTVIYLFTHWMWLYLYMTLYLMLYTLCGHICNLRLPEDSWFDPLDQYF